MVLRSLWCGFVTGCVVHLHRTGALLSGVRIMDDRVGLLSLCSTYKFLYLITDTRA